MYVDGQSIRGCSAVWWYMKFDLIEEVVNEPKKVVYVVKRDCLG
jgi:hypothetical protein